MTAPSRPSAAGLVTAAAAAGFGLMAAVDGIAAALMVPPLPSAILVATVPPPTPIVAPLTAPRVAAVPPPPAAVPLAPPALELEAVRPSADTPLEPGASIAADTIDMPLRWDLARVTITISDRDALGRVAFAEAAGQGEAGIAAVVFTILNRVASGRFEADVQGVVDAPGQFEPVMRAGGSWRNLPQLTPDRRLVFGTILNLIVDGRLPDPTNGAIYFQNAAIVAARAAAGEVRPSLVHFGGQSPIAVIRDHSFYGDNRAPSTGAGDVLSTPPRHPTVTAEAGEVQVGTDTAAEFEQMLQQGGGDLFAPITSAGEPPAGTNQTELFIPVDHPDSARAEVSGPTADDRAATSAAPVYIESAADPGRSLFVP